MDSTRDATDVAADVRLAVVQAQEAERARLAQEVHDGPAQALTNAIFQVEFVEGILDQDPEVARNELRFLRELLRRELGDIRAFISRLRPRTLDQLGLEGSISETAENLAALTGARIETRYEAPQRPLTDAEQIVALRIVQEALQNVRRHAAARHVTVVARRVPGAWSLEVDDDGRGFDPTAMKLRLGRSFGLQFMRERADLIGAAFIVRSRPEGGTLVNLSIPMGEEST